MADTLYTGPHDPSLRRSLVTPEGVDLGLGLGSGGQRVGAFLLDLLIMIGMLVTLTLLIVGTALAIGVMGPVTKEILTVIWLLGSFLIRTFYFVMFEAGPRAATWGKRAVGLRVVARSGERLTMESVVARNLMREIEVFAPIFFLIYALFSPEAESGLILWGAFLWVLIFLCFPLFNKDRLRVGDFLAGTWVVRLPKRNLAYDLVAHHAAQEAPSRLFTPEQLDAYGVFELQTLEQVLRAGHPETLHLVAGTIREKIGYWGDPQDPWQFLSAYYAEARARMERDLLFGKRRANKFDR